MNESPKKPERRTFIVQGSWLMGGLTLSGAFAGSLLAGTSGACLVNAKHYPDACGDWTVDHVCAAWPPYSFHTGPAQPHNAPLSVAVADVDRYWLM
jgi:hypothetical protein